MKVFFIVDENGKYISADGCRKYRRFTGRKLYEHLRTPEGKKKVFDIAMDDLGNMIGVEVPIEMQKMCRAVQNRSEYVKMIKKQAKITEISFDGEESDCNGDNWSYYETIEDESIEDMIEVLAREEEINKLKEALKTLTDEEYDIIYNLFLSDNPISERDYAKLIGLSRTTIQSRKFAIFKKLRNFF